MNVRKKVDFLLNKDRLVFKSFLFLKIFENAQKNILKSANFFCFCFLLYKEKLFRDKATIKS